MNDIKLSLTGYEEIDSVLRGLPKLYTHRVMQAAHAEAAKPMLYKEHLLTPVGKTGKLAESEGIVKTPFSKAAVIGEIQLGPRRGRFGGSHGHLVEFGTGPRSFNGANRGVMPRKPYAKPAFEQTNDEVKSRISKAVGQKTADFMRRMIKNNG
jgi:hypothetical protein